VEEQYEENQEAVIAVCASSILIILLIVLAICECRRIQVKNRKRETADNLIEYLQTEADKPKWKRELNTRNQSRSFIRVSESLLTFEQNNTESYV